MVKVRVCPKCGHYNEENAWSCVNCSHTLSIQSIVELDDLDIDISLEELTDQPHNQVTPKPFFQAADAETSKQVPESGKESSQLEGKSSGGLVGVVVIAVLGFVYLILRISSNGEITVGDFVGFLGIVIVGGVSTISPKVHGGIIFLEQ